MTFFPFSQVLGLGLKRERVQTICIWNEEVKKKRKRETSARQSQLFPTDLWQLCSGSLSFCPRGNRLLPEPWLPLLPCASPPPAAVTLPLPLPLQGKRLRGGTCALGQLNRLLSYSQSFTSLTLAIGDDTYPVRKTELLSSFCRWGKWDSSHVSKAFFWL